VCDVSSSSFPGLQLFFDALSAPICDSSLQLSILQQCEALELFLALDLSAIVLTDSRAAAELALDLSAIVLTDFRAAAELAPFL